jgi:hypothetical protein
MMKFWLPATLTGLLCGPVQAAERDLGLWIPVQFIHPFGEAWSVSLQTEVRLKDNISEFSELILKPAINYHFNETWALSLGYKYIDKYQHSNEQDPWQELHYNWKCADWTGGHQVRLEERCINGIDGVLPRIRFLTHVAHPFGDGPYYATGFGAVRFNLDDKVNGNGRGPVSGFEQVRLYLGLGRYLGKHVQAEIGYLYRYELERTSEDKSDHVIRLQLVFNTKGKLIQKPNHRDHYR